MWLHEAHTEAQYVELEQLGDSFFKFLNFLNFFLYQFSDLEAEPMVVVWQSVT